MSEQNSDFGDDELRKCTDDANDADFVPPSGKTKSRNRKSSAGARKIQHPWTQEEIFSLIAAVKKRRGLWDVHSDEYKLSKLDGWREVYDELGLQIDLKEVKSKWSSLRVSFNVNLANYRKKKSRQSANETFTVAWRYFQQMLFLEVNDVNQSTKSMSTMESSAVGGQSIVDDFLVSAEPTSVVSTGTRRKRRNATPTPTPPMSPAPSSNSSFSAILKKSVVPLETSDRNTAFCEYLLSELRSLSEAKALDLRRALNQTLWNFLDSDQPEQVQLTPVQLVDEQGLNIPMNTLNVKNEPLPL